MFNVVLPFPSQTRGVLILFPVCYFRQTPEPALGTRLLQSASMRHCPVGIDASAKFGDLKMPNFARYAQILPGPDGCLPVLRVVSSRSATARSSMFIE